MPLGIIEVCKYTNPLFRVLISIYDFNLRSLSDFPAVNQETNNFWLTPLYFKIKDLFIFNSVWA